MLSNLFFSLLKINAMATIVAVIVLALKYVLKKCGASRKLLFYLWIIIALRFVCPNFIESNFSLFNIFDNPISEEKQVAINDNQKNITNINNFIPTDIDFNTNNVVTDNTVVNAEINEIQTIIPSELVVKEQSNNLEITEILMLVWIAGSSGMILYALVSYLKLKKKVMFAVKGDGDYYETDMIMAPCVLGIIRPKIYLTLNLTEKEKKYILTHEKIHIKRKDYFTKFIAYMILAIHWINPVSWVLFKMFVNDMEMLCDEESLKKIGEENKVGYMESLVNLASKNRKNILPCPIAFSENNTEKRVKNMIKYKKSGIIISIVALVVCIIIAAICLTNSNTLNDENNSENLYKLFNYDYALNGKSGTSLFIDSISEDEYDELVKLLYPNGIIDEQGQEIGIVDNSVEIRRNFINEHTKAYTIVDGTTKEVELEKFYINLDELSNELYNSSFEDSNEYLFYKAKVNEDVFVFPSECGNEPFGFIEASEDNSYYIYWYLGVWKINTDNLTIEKITSDEYNGKSYMDIRNEMNDEDGGYLVWIDSAIISPNNEYIIYRSNRGSQDLNETSLWKIDLTTGKEEKFLDENINNDIVGFASDDVVVVGSIDNTRLVNLKNLNVKKIEIPPVENMAVRDVRNGKLIYSTYKDNAQNNTTILNTLNLETGELIELDRIEGHYTNLGNVEGFNFNDMIYLQNDVDNGHYSYRLKVEDVVCEYLYRIYGIKNENISNVEYINSNEAIADYTLNNETYRLEVFKPIRKDDTGIWIVKSCNLYNIENIINTEIEKVNLEEWNKIEEKIIYGELIYKEFGSNMTYTDILTEQSKLQELNDYLFTYTNAIKGGTACPFTATLILRTEIGKEIELQLATDSCTVFRIGEQYYEYTEDKGEDDPDEADFYKYFDKINAYINGEPIRSISYSKILGYNAYYKDTIEPTFITRNYYTKINNVEYCIAESFGFGKERDDISLDIDGDGIEELICNCTYGGDGHQEVYIFKRNMNTNTEIPSILIGKIDPKKVKLPELHDWGANAILTGYDKATNRFWINYSKGNEIKNEYSTVYLDLKDAMNIFTFEEFNNITSKTKGFENNSTTSTVYIDAIKNLYYNYKLPDGTELEDPKYVDDYNMSENQFAICDVDMDGKEELLIALTHYPMAAMRTIIYDYDLNTNKFREQLTGFNWMNFYNNGSLEVMWSHNQGSAGDSLWPYTLYRYNNEQDSFEVVAEVDAWDKSFSETCYIDEIFPENIDKDGNGIVYYVRNSDSDEYSCYDLNKFNEWKKQYITNETSKITVPYINLVEENINNI